MYRLQHVLDNAQLLTARTFLERHFHDCNSSDQVERSFSSYGTQKLQMYLELLNDLVELGVASSSVIQAITSFRIVLDVVSVQLEELTQPHENVSNHLRARDA